MKTITLDGVGYPVESPELATAIATLQKAHTKLEKTVDKLTADSKQLESTATAQAAELETLRADAAKVPELQSQLDSITGERDALKAAALTADAIAVAAQERVLVADQVAKMLPDAAIDWTKTPEQMRRDAIAAKGMEVDGKSDDYVAGVFSALVAAAPQQLRADAIAKSASHVPTVGSNVTDLAALRLFLDEERSKAYQGGK